MVCGDAIKCRSHGRRETPATVGPYLQGLRMVNANAHRTATRPSSVRLYAQGCRITGVGVSTDPGGR